MNSTDSQQLEQLRITEIFFSLQGESRTAGIPTVFIRLTGCPLRCVYCDTTYAFQGGAWMGIDDILKQISQYKTTYVTVTGGEPLAQKACLSLLNQLCDAGYQVSLETSGALDVCHVDERVVKVMDLKTPASGEQEKNRWQNIECLNSQDQIKFVICNEDDYRWSVQIVSQYDLTSRCEVLFSPSYGEMDAATLAQWVLQDQLPVRFQMQLHKLLWGNEPGR